MRTNHVTMMHPRPGNLSREEVEKKVNTGEFWMEEKLDGIRAWVTRDRHGVHILTKNGYDATDRFPYIAGIMEDQFAGYNWWLDGEITSSAGFNDVQSVLAGGTSPHTVTFRPFDLLAWPSQEDLYKSAFRMRRSLLEQFTKKSYFVPVEQWVIKDEMMPKYDLMAKNKREGIVLKRWADDYHDGNIWFRSKFNDTVNVVPIDIEDATLMVQCGMWHPDGGIRHVCDVQVDNDDLMLLLSHMGSPDAPIQPVLEVAVYGVDPKGNLRHPTYKGLRFEGHLETSCSITQLRDLRRV